MGVHLVVPPGGSFRETRRIPLGAEPLTIGRADKCEIRIDVPGIDDEHATITIEALIAIGPDCAVGDVPMDAGVRRLVQPGDEIMIGPLVLAIEGTPNRLPGSANAPRIRVVEGENAGSEVLLAFENKEYIIGRAKTADLVLKDREVSREHLKVTRKGFAIHVYDAASTRGSFLGRAAVYQGSTIEWQRPRMLKVGATVLALDLPPEAGPVPSAVPSAPQTFTPRAPATPQTFTPSPEALAEGPPTNVGVFHYEAKPQNDAPIVPSSAPSLPPSSGMPGLPNPISNRGGALDNRGGWKKSGTQIGKGSGLLLLVIGGLVILGGLFVIFSLME